jgi:DNA-directed RNA polymerase subunit RPC12/RpoP
MGWYHCKDCGNSFWRGDHPGFKVSHCPKCGAVNLIPIITIENAIQLQPPPLTDVRIKLIEPPPSHTKQKYQGQYFCKACGHLFWREEYVELKVSHCQKCGSSDLMHIGTIQFFDKEKHSPTMTIRIKTVEKGPLPPPPPPLSSEQGKYRSQFRCYNCGRSFWIYEHRTKIPYCQECGASNPIYVATAKL